MKPEVLAALCNPHLQLAAGVPLNTALRELIGLPAPAPINFSIGPAAVDARQVRSFDEWAAVLREHCTFFAEDDLKDVIPVFLAASATAPDLLERLFSLVPDPIESIQLNFFRNKLVELHAEAVAAVHAWWRLSVETEGQWATLFLTWHAESMVAAHINARLSVPTATRPSPFLYAMA